MAPKIELSGMVFNNWTVLSEDKSKTMRGGLRWLCQCSCGEVKSIASGYLRQRKSNGCSKCSTKNPPNSGGRPAHNRLPSGVAQSNVLFNRYKNSARERKYTFNLTKQEFLILTKQPCFYCGDEPSQIASKTHYTYGDYTYNGIDRVDNYKGYSIDNCVACCKFCNRAKDVLTTSEFLDKIRKIFKHGVEYLREVEYADKY